MDPTLTAAIVGLIVVVTAILQSWHQRWSAKHDKAEVKQEVKKVEKAVNGEGLGGKLDMLMARLATHEEQDRQQFAEVLRTMREKQ